MKKVKTQFVFPEDLLKALDSVVGARKRSLFVVEATRERLNKIRFEMALEEAIGSWTDENHPELKTDEDVRKYIRDLRIGAARRLEKLKNDE